MGTALMVIGLVLIFLAMAFLGWSLGAIVKQEPPGPVLRGGRSLWEEDESA